MPGWLGISGLGHFDRQALMLANSWRSAPLDAALASLIWLGSLLVLLPLAAATWMLVQQLAPGRGRRALSALLLMVMLVDLSRIYLQVHYPSDAPAGSIMDICWVVGLGRMFKAGRATTA